jgi:HlyD family secretion protein
MNTTKLLTKVNLRRFALVILGLAVLVAFGFVVARSGPMAPVKVTVVSARDGDIKLTLFGLATVEARRSYLIGPTQAGRVQHVAVDVGDRVKQGDLLAEMDPIDLDARMAAAQAAVTRARSNVGAAEAQINDMQARQALAAGNAKRYVELGQKNFISPSAVDARLQEHASAQAAQQVALANLTGARDEIVRLESERQGLLQQRKNLHLLAPADALVSVREAESGSTVLAGQAVVRLIDPASLWLKLRLDQGRSAGLAVGLPASITLRSRSTAPLSGKVVRLEQLSDSITEERIAHVAFDHLPPDLTIGELAEVTVELPKERGRALLPSASIQRRGTEVGVWRLNNGALSYVPVRLGLQSSDGQVQVLEGVEVGDTVVVHREKSLTETSRITVVETLVEARP